MHSINNSKVTLADFIATAEEVASDLCDLIEEKRSHGEVITLQRDMVMTETFRRLNIETVDTVPGKSQSTVGKKIQVDFGGLFTFLQSQGAFAEFDTVRGQYGGVQRRSTAEISAAKAKLARSASKTHSAAERLADLRRNSRKG